MGRLAGKVAFITGTAGGQGHAAACLFASEGAYVVGCDLKCEEAARTVAMVREAGGQMISSYVDLCDPQSGHDWIENGVRAAGRIDILYNNAGAARFGPLDRMALKDWSYTLCSELDSVFHTIRAAWPHLRAGGGSAILNTASVVARHSRTGSGMVAHTAAKGAVVALTRQVAAEGAPYGIRVNSISPGPVESPATAHLRNEAEAFAKSIPLGRWGRPEDIAYCALYLVSDETSWVTGADFVIDGGVSSIR